MVTTPTRIEPELRGFSGQHIKSKTVTELGRKGDEVIGNLLAKRQLRHLA
jgi:hypothetical protein